MRAEVVKIDEKTHVVMLGDHEIGRSKNDVDARFHMHAINDALDSVREDIIKELDVLGMASLVDKSTGRTLRQVISNFSKSSV